jgi:hypothetical protein
VVRCAEPVVRCAEPVVRCAEPVVRFNEAGRSCRFSSTSVRSNRDRIADVRREARTLVERLFA